MPFNWWGACSGGIFNEGTCTSELIFVFRCHLRYKVHITGQSSSKLNLESLWPGECLPQCLCFPFLGIEKLEVHQTYNLLVVLLAQMKK